MVFSFPEVRFSAFFLYVYKVESHQRLQLHSQGHKASVHPLLIQITVNWSVGSKSVWIQKLNPTCVKLARTYIMCELNDRILNLVVSWQ